MPGHQAHVDRDRDHVAGHRDQAGNHRGGEQLGDVLLGQDGVDHERHAGRNQDAERAPGGQCAGGQALRIAVALELRQRHRGDGGRGGHRGAANGAECGAGDHRGHRQPAAKARHGRRSHLEQGAADAALGGEVAHQDEQRDHRQVVAGKARERLGVEKTRQWRPTCLQHIADQARREHRHRDRRAQRHQRHHDGEDQQRQLHRRHSASTLRWPRSAWVNAINAVSTNGGTMPQ